MTAPTSILKPGLWQIMDGHVGAALEQELTRFFSDGFSINSPAYHLGDLVTTPMCAAARFGMYDALHVLHGLGANMTTEDLSGCSPIVSAVRGGQVGSLKILHDLGCDFFANNSIKYPTLMHVAANEGVRAPLEFLLSHGIDPYIANMQGDTAIHMAVYTPHVLCELHRLGVDMNVPNEHTGNTVAHDAVRMGHVNSWQTILALDLDLDKKNAKHFSARDLAFQDSHPEIKLITQSWENSQSALRILEELGVMPESNKKSKQPSLST